MNISFYLLTKFLGFTPSPYFRIGLLIIIIIITCLNKMTISVIKTAVNMVPVMTMQCH